MQIFSSGGVDDLRVSVVAVHRLIGVHIVIPVGQNDGRDGQGVDRVEVRLFQLALHLRQLRTILHDVLNAVQRLRRVEERKKKC